MKFRKLDVKGFVHHIAFVIVVLGVAIIGTAYLVASHADSCQPVSASGSLTSGSVTSGSTCPASSPVTGTGSATLRLSPTTATRKIDTPVSFKIAANSGSTAVNAVQVDLNYNKSQLQYIGTSTSGSPYSLCVQNSGGNGETELACAISGGTTSENKYVGTVTFNVIGTGTSVVSFNSSSAVDQPTGTNIWNNSTAGASLSLLPGNAAISLSPSSATEPQNSTFSVNVNESSLASDAINAVQAVLDYPSTQLQYVSSTCSSSFPLAVHPTNSSGIANLVCSVPNKSYTGAQTVGTVTFKAIGTAGTAVVSVDKSSEVLIASNQANDWNGKPFLGKYKLTTVK